MTFYPLLVGLGLALGVAATSHALLATLVELISRIFRPHHSGRLARLGVGLQALHRSQKETEGVDAFPWRALYGFSFLIGLLLAQFGPWLAAARLGSLGLPLLVWLARRYLSGQSRRFMAGQVRQFLIDLRLHMSLQGSLLLGLESLARSTQERSAIYRRLEKYFYGSRPQSGLELLTQLAEAISSPHLTRAAQHILAAQQSGGLIQIDQAVAGVIADLEEELGYQSEEQMQRLPLRITLLAMPFLLGPVVILLFYPLIDRILRTLTGVSIGGGF